MTSDKLPITILIAVKNEAANITRCLEALKPAAKVIVLDSQSEDETVKTSRKMRADVVQFRYRGGYPKKRQWALSHLKIKTPWVLLLDADEQVTRELWAEINIAIKRPDAPSAFLIKKKFYFLGKKFNFGGFSFEAVLLFRRGMAKFEKLIHDPTDMDMEVHERLIVNGPLGRLKEPLIHNDFKGLEAYFARHNKYSTWEAELRHSFLKTGRYGEETIKPRFMGNAQERRRFLKRIVIRLPLESMGWFIYHYFLKLGFLEGKRGLVACQIRAQYIAQVRAKIYEISLKEDFKSR